MCLRVAHVAAMFLSLTPTPADIAVSATSMSGLRRRPGRRGRGHRWRRRDQPLPTRDRFAAYSGTAPIEASSCTG
jgi:hypothetical protein